MTTRHLKIFLEVYKSGSMTAAAKRLFMTQPSVSQAIHEMEEHYGVRLFERLYRKLFPTPAGKELVLYAENILGLFDEMEAKLEAGNLAQSLEVGLFFTAGMLVHPWLSAFRAACPSTSVHIHVWKGSELKRRLRTASIDLAVMEEFDHEPDLCQELIAEDRLVAVTAVDDPLLSEGSITARQLSEAPLLLREKGAGVRDQFESEMQRLGFHISPLWESASSLVLLESNHDPDMLRHNDHYNERLKQRILGNRGHLSNAACADALLQIVESGTKNVILGHLSGENNTPSLAYHISEDRMTREGIRLGQDLTLDVALRDRVGNIYTLGDGK